MILKQKKKEVLMNRQNFSPQSPFVIDSYKVLKQAAIDMATVAGNTAGELTTQGITSAGA